MYFNKWMIWGAGEDGGGMGNKRGPSHPPGTDLAVLLGFGTRGEVGGPGDEGAGWLSYDEEESFGYFVGYAVAAKDADEGEGEFH